ncbi:MAG: FmdB family transcriptional regulator [Anaerolineae bacterium UTCFX2]|jgi:putative FmdB family regulatory protein|nr:zinc ribbon domain-containing protein [Anaerolineales bacterium]OQY87359.1 MAG: FmdB family transcriptional regulator [Anaerolineae bacterium UTCFX2]
MPVYTYRCKNCGFVFDQQQKFSDQPLTRCPECEKKALQKVYQPVGIVFKGSGFYATDHRSPSGQHRSSNKSESDKSSSSDSATAAEKPSESSKSASSASSDD